MSDAKVRKLESILALVLIVIGGGASAYQLKAGPAVTALSNGFDWGLYIAIFELLVGMAGGCLFLHGLIRFRRYEPLEGLKRDAGIAGFALVAAADLMITLDLGDVWHMGYLLTSTNLSSPLAGDMAMMTVFVLVSLACIFSRKGDKPLGILAMLLGIAAPVVTSLIFSEVSARAWWHTPLVPIGFLFIGFASGTALMALIGLVALRGDESQAQREGLKKLCSFAVVMTAAFLIVEVIRIVVAASGTAATSPLASNGALIAAEIATLVVALVLYLMQRKKTSGAGIVAASILLIVGDLLYRMMLLYGGLNTLPLTLAGASGTGWAYPISTGIASSSTFMASIAYLPTPVEWAVVALPIGIALLLVVLLRLLTTRIDGKKAGAVSVDAAA